MTTPRPFKRLWNWVLDIDSAIDAGLYGLGQWVAERWTEYCELVDRMRIAGLKRVFVDIASDSLSYATAVALVFYAWALPETPPEEELRAGARQYSVIFTDRNGRYIGRRTYVKVGQDLAGENGQKTTVEYDVAPDWKVGSSTTSKGSSDVEVIWHKRY